LAAKLTFAAFLLVFASSCARRVECRLFPNQEAAICRPAPDGSVVVDRQSLAGMSFEPDGLTSIFIGNQLHFVNRQGRTAPAFPFDNGADNVVEGLARTVKAGKVGFVNPALDVVVPPVWDFAYPFEKGAAKVCTGCVPRPVRPGDEHTIVTGGKWGYIDKSGKVIVPVVYEWSSLPSDIASAR
jgi:hypothetical protein